jgi:AcrR family transcriptional regulator
MPKKTAHPRTAETRVATPRPRPGPLGTRERILGAAILVFSAAGYSGARIEAICKRARANPRMIYHYFGDKDGLYRAVLEHVLGDLRREELQLAVDDVPPLDGMLQLFDFIHGHFRAHPELITIMSGENLLRARFLKKSIKTPVLASPLIELIRSLLARGVTSGAFRAGIDALQLYVMMVALSCFHRSNAHTLSAIFKTDLQGAGWQAEQRRHAEQMLVAFLRKAPG